MLRFGKIAEDFKVFIFEGDERVTLKAHVMSDVAVGVKYFHLSLYLSNMVCTLLQVYGITCIRSMVVE